MAATVREYLMYHLENSYGVAHLNAGAPAAGEHGFIRLEAGNAFNVRPVQQSLNIMYGGGYAVPVTRVGGNITCKGTLRTILHYSQANTLLNWAMTSINTGRTSPWNTSDPSGIMPVGDLASLSLYHAIMASNGTFYRRAYRGAKVNGLRIECSAEAPLAIATFDIETSKPEPNASFGGSDTNAVNTTEFPAPTFADYPTDPCHFFHTAGGLFIGATRTLYDSISIDIKNTIDRKYYETKWVAMLPCLGREARLKYKALLKASPDDRQTYEYSNTTNCSIKFNSTNSVTITYNAQNRIDNPPADDLPLDRVYEQEVEFLNYYDNTANADITVTVT